MTSYNELVIHVAAMECIAEAARMQPLPATEGFNLEFHHEYKVNMDAISKTITELNKAIKEANPSKIIKLCDTGIAQCESFRNTLQGLPPDKFKTVNNLMPFFIMIATTVCACMSLGINPLAKVNLPVTVTDWVNSFANFVVTATQDDENPITKESLIQNRDMRDRSRPKGPDNPNGLLDYLGSAMALITDHNGRGARIALAIPQVVILVQQIRKFAQDCKYAKVIRATNPNDPNIGNRRYAATLGQIDDTIQMFVGVKKQAREIATAVKESKAETIAANEAIIFSPEWRAERKVKRDAKKAQRAQERAERQKSAAIQGMMYEAYDNFFGDNIIRQLKLYEKNITTEIGTPRNPPVFHSEEQLRSFIVGTIKEACQKVAKSHWLKTFLKDADEVLDKNPGKEYLLDLDKLPAGSLGKAITPSFEYEAPFSMDKNTGYVHAQLINDDMPGMTDFAHELICMCGACDAILMYCQPVFRKIPAVVDVNCQPGMEHCDYISVTYKLDRLATEKEAVENFLDVLFKSPPKRRPTPVVSKTTLQRNEAEKEAAFMRAEHEPADWVWYLSTRKDGPVKNAAAKLDTVLDAKVKSIQTINEEYDGKDLYNRMKKFASDLLKWAASTPEFKQREAAMQKILDEHPCDYFLTGDDHPKMSQIAKSLKISDSDAVDWDEGFEVIHDATQEVNIWYISILGFIEEALEKAFKYSLPSIGSGDGDEGHIYYENISTYEANTHRQWESELRRRRASGLESWLLR